MLALCVWPFSAQTQITIGKRARLFMSAKKSLNSSLPVSGQNRVFTSSKSKRRRMRAPFAGAPSSPRNGPTVMHQRWRVSGGFSIGKTACRLDRKMLADRVTCWVYEMPNTRLKSFRKCPLNERT
jgi:hypothetical protein